VLTSTTAESVDVRPDDRGGAICPAPEPPILTVRTVAAAHMLSVSVETLRKLPGLRPVRVGPRGALRYRMADILKYIESLPPA